MEPGRFLDKFAHLYNFMPTLLELSGAEYPETFNGVSGRKILGDSFADVIYDQPIKHQDPGYMSRGGQEFIIDGGWELVTEDGKNWSMYILNKEETEITDLSKKRTGTVQYLACEIQGMESVRQIAKRSNKNLSHRVFSESIVLENVNGFR